MDAEINDSGELILIYQDGKEQNLGVVVGKDGSDGVNGEDDALVIDGYESVISAASARGLRSALVKIPLLWYNDTKGGAFMSDFFSYVSLALVGAFWVAVIIRIATKTYRNKHTSTKTVTATVVDKRKTEMFSRFGALDQRYRCSVTFSVAGKRLSFFVPVATYDSYRLHTTGTLTYRGDKLVDFH